MTNILIVMLFFLILYSHQSLKRRIEDIEFRDDIIDAFSNLDRKIDSIIISNTIKKEDKEHIL